MRRAHGNGTPNECGRSTSPRCRWTTPRPTSCSRAATRSRCSSSNRAACASCSSAPNPIRFEDIIALAALFRPGPLGSGMDRDWVDRKHGHAEVSYPHPRAGNRAEADLRRDRVPGTGDADRAAAGGYSLGGADLLRRAMGKKKPEEMAKERAKFETGRRRTRRRSAQGDADLRPDGEVRRVRLQQVALGRLCAGRVPDRVAEGALPGRVHGRGAVERHGQHRQGGRCSSTRRARWA